MPDIHTVFSKFLFLTFILALTKLNPVSREALKKKVKLSLSTKFEPLMIKSKA
jgi:hypothetical protein